MQGETVKAVEWRFAPQGVYVCPSRTMNIGLEPGPGRDTLYGVEVAEAINPTSAERIAAVLNAILDSEPGGSLGNIALRLVRFEVWEKGWVAATNERGQSTMMTQRPTADEARELANRLNAALDWR